MIAAGTVLAGRYRIVRHVGSGGMASVYLAEDTTLGRSVAVKRIHADPESELGRRINREARLGAGLRHPNVVTIFDVVADGEALLLVMEFVDGETLADLMRRGPLEPARALAVLRPLASALDALHAQGIVHRDVKPANVLLGRGGTVKLTDLGVATSADATQITQTGGVLGTAAYMAPEQFDAGPVTGSADVYALGAVAYELLAGRRPYTGASAFEVLARVRDGTEAPDVREHRPELPQAVSDALRHGMALRGEDRPSSAGAFADEVERALGGASAPAPTPAPAPPRAPTRRLAPDPAPTPVPTPTPPAASAPPPTRGRRSRAPAAALLGLVAALGAVAAVALGTGGGDDPADRRAEAPTATRAQSTPRTTTTTTTTARAASGPSTPRGAVRAFYERAADGDLAGSWALAGPEMRAAFGGSFERFSGDLGSLRDFEFRRLAETARDGDTATVNVRTVARHTDRTDRCSGDLRTVRDGDGGWLVEPAGISCSST